MVQTASGSEERTVRIGINDRQYAQVLEGLRPGERVVIPVTRVCLMAEPLIVLHNVTRHFTAGTQIIPVLKSVSLTIMPGEMVAIMGASGSGKSTLMNIIGCLDKPSSGEVYINDIAIHQADSASLAELRSRWLGFIFQRYHLMPYLTAEENIAIPALYTAMPAAERRARIALLAEKLGIDGRLQHKPAQLSGGQQQRVSVCRALINGAQIILADEPTGALDSVSGRALMDVLHQLNADGHTVIIVTHDREVAQQAQRIVEISDGQVVADHAYSARDNRDVQRLPAVEDNGRASLSRSIGESVRMAALTAGTSDARLSVDAGDHHRYLVRGFFNGGGEGSAEHHERDW